MKNTRLITLAVLGALTMSSCGENQQEQDTPVPMQNDTRMGSDEHEDHDMMNGQGNLDDGMESASPEFNNENMAAVYEHYMHVKSALVNSDPSEASNGAEMMVESLQEAQAEQNAIRAAREISENEELNAQRTAFSDLSASVESMMEGAVTSGEIYKQYCPMAFEGAGGYWLSASEEVRNPYYGDKMLKCGRVSDTIQ